MVPRITWNTSFLHLGRTSLQEKRPCLQSALSQRRLAVVAIQITSPWTQSRTHYWQQAFETALLHFFFHSGKTIIDRLERIFKSLMSGINKRKGQNVCLWLGKQYLERKKPLWSRNYAISTVLSMVQVHQKIPLQLKVWR